MDFGKAESLIFVQEGKSELIARLQQPPHSVKLEIGDEKKEAFETYCGQQTDQKRLFTDVEGKKNRNDSNKKYCDRRIGLSKQAWDRWNNLKTSLNVPSHSELAWLLMDCWFERQESSEQQTSTVDSSLSQTTGLDAENVIKLENGEIKVEINSDNEQPESASNDSTDVEYDELVNFVNNRKKTDVENVCSKEMDHTEMNCSTENTTISNTGELTGFNKKIDNTNTPYDPDYNPKGDTWKKRVPTNLKKHIPNFKTEQEGKKFKKASQNGKKEKGKIPEPKKPWVKIQLTDHEDKYKIETVESFARMNRKIDASENLYCCLVCQHFKCASRDKFEEHIEKHVNKALECEYCEYIANSDIAIREHKWTCCKNPEKSNLCSICGHWTGSNESRRLHMGKVHGIAEWKCLFCAEKFNTRTERLGHMRIAHEEACQYCECCKRSKHLLSKDEYKSHLESCRSNVQCQICGMLIAARSILKHMNDKHEKIRKHQCPKCPYAAKTSRRLKTHLLSHDKIHPHSCSLCSFTCIQPNQLKSHMRTHTGEKPYKCKQCKYAAAWNVQLKEHVKVHCMETAVMCQNCDVLFKNEKTLNMHMKKEHFK
ncbi:zinc finger protein 43-like [Mercenaria mercenaria]|uniref:zinc finger protein 43-like n=1 Tax=Mercenaria mercenaria TaxID=6596 RepID=UPI00234FAD9D|nr:zinc finger protein 43-like [Mercenaria mercenaria]